MADYSPSSVPLSQKSMEDIIEHLAVLEMPDLMRLVDIADSDDFSPDDFYLEIYVDLALGSGGGGKIDPKYNDGSRKRGTNKIFSIMRELQNRICDEGEGNFDYCQKVKTFQDGHKIATSLAGFLGPLVWGPQVGIVLTAGTASVFTLKFFADSICDCPDTVGGTIHDWVERLIERRRNRKR